MNNLDSGSEWTWKTLSLFRRLVCALPHRAALRIGSCVGSLVWLCCRKRVDNAEARCVYVLGVGVTVARTIVRESYRNLGRSLVEFVRLPVTRERVLQYVHVHGEENLRTAFDEGRGVILLTAHMGNWEYTAATLALGGYPMNAIGADQRDPRITALIGDLRGFCGVKTIGKGFDLKAAVRCLRKGEILGVLLDQDFRDKGLPVPFLGVPASTPFGPVKMAEKIGSRVVPLFIVRRPDRVNHDLYILPALEGKEGKPFGVDTEESLRQCNDVLGEWIERHPDHWMWLYSRWASTMGDRP